jgi:hypothetical protein
MGSWLNSDGLYVEYGPDEVTVVDGGEYNVLGSLHEVEIEINLAGLATATESILSDTIQIPSGARIERVDLIVETAATSGGSATLDFGLIRLDRTTELDYNGFVAGIALAAMSDAGARISFVPGNAAGDSVPPGPATGGALLGTTLSNTGLLTAGANTAVFTAGRLKARVYWYNP